MIVFFCKPKVCLGLLAFCSFALTGSANDERLSPPIAGEIIEVTLYRDSALITRQIPIKPGKGPREIVVNALPEQLVISSVFAEGTDSLSIRAVQVVQEPIDGSVREEVQQLDEELKSLNRQLNDLEHVAEESSDHLGILKQLTDFTHRASNDDLNRGILNAESLQQMWSFTTEQRHSFYETIHKVQREHKEVEQAIQRLTRERSKLTAGTPQTRFLSRIYLDGDHDKVENIRLSYTVSGCRWSPQYAIAAQSDSGKLNLRYGAIIEQLSGEDWNEIQLTLSTASPSVSASGPTLTPLRITAVPSDLFQDDGGMGMAMSDPFAGSNAIPSQKQQAMPSQVMSGPISPNQITSGGAVLQRRILSLRNEQREIENSPSKSKGRAAEQQRDVMLNRLAGEMQEIELRASATTARGLASDAQDEVASQTYVLESPVSLQSRREQQLVEIVDADLDGKLYHTATPLLSSFAYREAELTNTLAIGLLSGPATVYLDDRFVGTMSLPTTASGQLMTLGFGADGQVRTRRELVSKDESVQGGNKRLKSSYKLVVNNFKDQPISVRLLDRIPVSGQSQQTSIELGETSTPLSDDALYARVQRPMGILRWDLDIAASRHGSDAFDVTHSYSVEFDRNRVLSVPPPTAQDVTEMNMDGMGGGMGGGGMGGGGR